MLNQRKLRVSASRIFVAAVTLTVASIGFSSAHADGPVPITAGVSMNAIALTDAATAGNVVDIKQLLDSGAPIDGRRPENGWTALISAARAGKVDAAQVLIDRGADLNAASFTGYTPLMAACEFGSTDLIRRLLLHGADPNKATPSGLTPLMLAAANKLGIKAETIDLDNVRLLLRGGADPDMRHKSGATALAIAQSHHAYRIAAYLRMMGSPTASAGTGSLAAAGPAASTGDGTITGTVLYRERVGVLPYAFVQVRFLDISHLPATLLSQTVVPLGGRQIPVKFSLPYDSTLPMTRPYARFGVDARIIEGGSVVFKSPSPTPTLIPGYPDKKIFLMLQMATPDQQTALANDAINATDRAIELAGRTFTGRRVAGDSSTEYKASFIGNRLVRIVADTNQASYGTRNDRFYFGNANDERGLPALRASILNARRIAQGNAVAGMRPGPGIGAGFEHVTQKIIVDDSGTPIVTSKKVADQDEAVHDPDITAARNFAHMLVLASYQLVVASSKKTH